MRRSALVTTLAGAMALGLTLLPSAAGAGTFLLTNGPGPGTVSVPVDGYGSFGSGVFFADSFDPPGSAGPMGTTFESGVAIRFGSSGPRSFLTSGSIGGSGLLSSDALPSQPPATGMSLTSFFSPIGLAPLSFTLVQTLVPVMSGPTPIGTGLTQTYTITNTGDAPVSFELIRYFDGDLGDFTNDGGGRLGALLFETDTATGTSTSTVFVAISAEGGTIPGVGRFEVDCGPSLGCSSPLLSRIIAGDPLGDTVAGDGPDPDTFIDSGPGYDVSLAFRNLFTLNPRGLPGDSGVYITGTVFAGAAPEEVVDRVPAPATLLLLGLGLAGLGLGRRLF